MSDDPLGMWLRGDDPAAPAESAPSPDAARRSPLDDEAPEPGARHRWRLVALVALPWLLVLGLGAAALAPDASPDAGPGVAPSVASADAAPTPSPSGTPPTPTPPPATAVTPAAAPAEGAARAAAVLAVRAAVTSAPDEAPRYVDLAAAETVEQVGDLAVVTVAAVVLEGDGDRWARARTARFAVPIRAAGGTAAAVGSPWPLPPPPEPEAPAWSPATEGDTVSATAAVEAAGYRDVTDVRLSSSSALAGVLRAELRAIAPGETGVADHTLLLRDAAPPTVLGVVPASAAQPTPAVPSTDPPEATEEP